MKGTSAALDKPPASRALRHKGIQLDEEIGRGTFSRVYRARLKGRTVAVKLYRGTMALDDALRMCRREASLNALLRHPAIPRVYDVGLCDAGPYIINEYIDGQTLAGRLKSGPIGVDDALDLIAHLADALSNLHRRGVIHRDIKPGNILLTADGFPKIIDFGLAGRREETLEKGALGTLLYSAPEQLGVLNCPVDARSDLYALGQVLFHCISGRRAFECDDAGELLHQLATTKAPRLDALVEDLAPEIADIVDALLQKDPDDRPSSALELLEMLERARPGSVTPPTERSGSTGHRFAPEADPVGRHHELTRLLTLSMTESPRRSSILVEGEPGSGKSHLLRAFAAQARREGVLVIQGQCLENDPYPMHALKEALNAFARMGSRPNSAGGPTFDKARLGEHLTPVAPLIHHLSPPLASALGFTTDGALPSDASGAIHHALTLVIRGLTLLYPNVVVLIDDIQWIDPASLSALTHLVTHVQPEGRLLFVFGSRNDPASMEALTTFRGAVEIHHGITLGPLSEDAVHMLIQRELGDDVLPETLDIITRRAGGSPLFVQHLLLAMLDNGALTPSPQGWVVHRDELNSLPLSLDIHGLLSTRLATLSERARAILALATLRGGIIDPAWLVEICLEWDARTVYDALTEGAQARLIEPRDDHRTYAFMHDRIREALRLHLPDDVSVYHKRTVDFLDRIQEPSPIVIYEKANHALLGYQTEDPLLVVRRGLAALEIAIDEHAWTKADDLLRKLLPLHACASLATDEKARFHRAAGVILFQMDEVAAAERHFRAALRFTGDKIQRLELRSWIARATIFTFDTAEGTKELERAFDELGQPLPSAHTSDPEALKIVLLERMAADLAMIEKGEGFGTARGDERAICRSLIELCDTGFLTGYYDRNVLFAMQCGILALRPAWALGTCGEAAQGFATFAFLMGVMGKTAPAFKFSDLALDIARRSDDHHALAVVSSTCALARHLAGDTEGALALQKEVFETMKAWLSPIGFQNCCVDLAWNYGIRGYAGEEYRVSQAAIDRLRDREGTFLGGYVCRAQASSGAALAFLGEMGDAFACFKEVARYRDIVPPDRTVPWISVEGFRTAFLLHQEAEADEVDAVARAHGAWGIPPERSALHSKHFYVFHAYARLGLVRRSDGADRDHARAEFGRAVHALENAATIPTLQTHVKVLQAAVALYSDKLDDVHDLLDEAERLADFHDNPWASHEAALVRADALAKAGHRAAAKRARDRAWLIARRMNWALRAQSLDRHDEGASFSSRSTHPSLETSARTTESSHIAFQARERRQLDALLSLSLASASVLDPTEQERIALDESIRILGAERAYLFIGDDEMGEPVFHRGRTREGSELFTPGPYSKTIVRRVFSEGVPLLLSPDTDQDLKTQSSIMNHDLRSIVAAPLLAGEKSLGVIYLDNHLARGIFGREDMDILLALGTHIANALRTAHSAQLELALKAETERRWLAETLRDIGNRLNSARGLPEFLDVLSASIRCAIPAERAAILICEDDRLALKHTHGLDESDANLWADRIRRSKVFDRDPLILSLPDPKGGSPWKGLALPLRKGDTLIGAILIVRNGAQDFGNDELNLASLLGGQISIALENTRLVQRLRILAEHDALTGLLNRREFFRRAELAFREARNTHRPLSTLMFDIDHFKHFNDTYGHSTGDEVIKSVAAVSQQSIRERDILGRYGGEEFAVLLPDVGAEKAKEIAERLRRAIHNNPPPERCPSDVRVTVSIGVAALGEEDDLKDLLARADQALYAAKREGRNRTMVAQ